MVNVRIGANQKGFTKMDIKVRGTDGYFTPRRLAVSFAFRFVKALGYKRCESITQIVYDLACAGF
jgi:hypothetical protein